MAPYVTSVGTVVVGGQPANAEEGFEAVCGPQAQLTFRWYIKLVFEPQNGSMNILIIGGSRNIGYYSALRFLEGEHTVTFLLRKTSIFDHDTKIQTALDSGQARLVQGDALVKEDIQRAWTSAIAHGKSGSCLLNSLTTLPNLQTRIVIITSVGLTRTSHAGLPLLLKVLYPYLLGAVHRDKIGAERLISHCAGWEWNEGDIRSEILAANWEDTPRLPSRGSVQEVLVIRPGLYTNGECLADTPGGKKYRVSEDELGGWMISRRDVAHFIADATLRRWSEFSGRRVNIMY
ncbi:hypothetical protein C0993_009774 [Termitomyces sp. T159_Od127]|nr:hypothetical protein C0993_009774 [Termitomyces sp. T159_Od127]